MQLCNLFLQWTLLRAQTGGWADVCDIDAFYHEKEPMFTLLQPILHTNTPPSTAGNSGLLVAVQA